jgi:basic membrane protein A
LGLLMDVARNDKSFGQATYEGAKSAAEELGLELTVVDSVSENTQKAQAALLNFAREDDYIINGAYALQGSLGRVAEQYPEKQFAAYAVAVKGPENVHWSYQDWWPLGWLAGVAAAEESKSGVIGFVGGGEIPPTIAGQAAYEAGAKATNPNIKVLSAITGNFDDATKAKDAAQAQIAQGADILYSFVDLGHVGVVAAAKEAGGVKVMGVILPKCDVSAGLDIGDTTSNQVLTINDTVHEMVEGTIKNIVYGVQDPEIAQFAFCPGISSKAKAAVEKAKEEFISEKLKTPEKYVAIQSGE